MLKTNRLHRILFSFSSGVLLSLAWLGFPGWMLFIAILPLLYLEQFFVENKASFAGVSFWGHAFLSALIWNGLTTWWIFHATLIGAIMAITVNSFLMSLVFWLAHFARRNLKSNLGYVAIVCFWISFEFFHFHWDIEWPWLTLGNGFANNIKLVQWYEFTGVLGGSLWVLIVNVLLLKIILLIINKNQSKQKLIPQLLIVFVVLFFPVIFSKIIYSSYIEIENPKKIVVVQPNVNPYSENYSIEAENEKLDKFILLAKSKTTNETDYIIGPETIVENYNNWNLDELNECDQYLKMVDFQKNYTDAEMFFGVSSSKFYTNEEHASKTARNKGGKIYDVFNTAIFIDKSGKHQVYHKSVLVSGVEKVPYLKYLGFLQNIFFDLGGASGNLGRQENPSVFISSDGTILAPVICYESVFGEYITNYVKQGAELIFIITNDGWWRNTPGYKQHLSFARLRAIESRRSIARAANTGISCLINQRGDIMQETNWWENAAINGKLNTNKEITFYVKYGDYIARIAVFVSALLVLLLITEQLRKDKKNPH